MNDGIGVEISMNPSLELQTERLILRRWISADRRAFSGMNADPEVMKYFPGVLSRAERDRIAERIEEEFAAGGFGLWALEVPGVASFAGFVGLSVPSFQGPFTPCVEIGW